jgi:predicted transcriptional regulator
MSDGFWNNHVVMDPADLEAVFANEDALGMSDMDFVEALREDRVADFGKVRDALPMLHPREADYLELYFFHRMRQSAIADLFGVSQPTVCYRLRRAATRIRYILTMPPYDRDKIEADLKSVISDPVDVRIMVEMIDSTCQSTVARGLGVTQGYVRHRFFRTLRALQSMHGMENYVRLFLHIASHLNIMKQVQRGAWNDPMIYVIA